jgi:hypothetical protein
VAAGKPDASRVLREVLYRLAEEAWK